MAKSRWKVEGFKELYKALEQLPKEAKKIIRQETRSTSKEWAKDLKANWPEDTGDTKRTIKVRSMKRSKKAIGSMATITEIGAGNVEFGTEDIEPRGIGRQTFKSEVPTKAGELEQRLAKRIDKEANRLGRNRPRLK